MVICRSGTFSPRTHRPIGAPQLGHDDPAQGEDSARAISPDELAVEVNPVVARLIEIDPALAASLKLLAMVGVVTVILKMRSHRRILQVSLAALI